MEVILREHVDNLGRRGEIVKVADGYARNYLLPRKLALLANGAINYSDGSQRNVRFNGHSLDDGNITLDGIDATGVQEQTMKADTRPTLPPTTMSQPFIEMPQRDEAFPSITTRPPCPLAAAHSEALPLTRTLPDMMFSATLQPTLPCTVMLARLFMPPMK